MSTCLRRSFRPLPGAPADPGLSMDRVWIKYGSSMDRVWIEYEWGRKDTPRPLSVLVEFEWIPQLGVFVGFQWDKIIASKSQRFVAHASGDARDTRDKYVPVFFTGTWGLLNFNGEEIISCNRRRFVTLASGDARDKVMCVVVHWN